jgi:Dopey, N-terminal
LPEKQLLAKRLAQCLTSSLPSGVHLKAIETYRVVFARIGTARLALDLPLYAGGLFPLLSYSATTLKPAVLSLYEATLLPLGPYLVPYLDGFVLAILPGLEDESSEFYERSVTLLDALADAVANDASSFCRALWRALLLSPPMRQPAANYIRIRLVADKKLAWKKCLLEDMPLVAYAMAAALNDANSLVQRNVLDLLLRELALHQSFFQFKSENCRTAAVALVRGVFGALLRKDMSLTKRVHSWLLGGKEHKKGLDYFDQFSRSLVIDAVDDEMACAVRTVLQSSSSSASLTRPCKILSGLLSRAELSEALACVLPLRVLRYARDMLQTPNSSYEPEIRHAVAGIVSQLGSANIFGELERVVVENEKLTDEPDMPHVERDTYELLTFAVASAPINDDVVRRHKLPTLLRAAVAALARISTHPAALKAAVLFCGSALDAMDVGKMAGGVMEKVQSVMPEVATLFTSFFMAWLATSVQAAPVEIRRAYSDVNLEDEVSAEFETAAIREIQDDCVAIAKSSCAFLTTLVASKVCDASTASGSLQAAAKCASCGDPRISLAGARAYAEIAAYLVLDKSLRPQEKQTYGVLQKTWRLLHPSLSTATASCAQVWLLSQRQFPDIAHVVVADGILSSIPARRLRNLERLACLWRLAMEHRLSPVPADSGLYLLLDALDDRDRGPKILARSWLTDAFNANASPILDAVLRLLLTPEAGTTCIDHEFAGVYDAPRALYAFHILRSIVESSVFGHSNPASGANALDEDDVDDENYALSCSTPSLNTLRPVIRAMVSASPSASTLAALKRMFSSRTGVTSDLEPGPDRSRTGSVHEKFGYDDGPIKLGQFFPVLDYASALIVTSLSYIRGRVPGKYTCDSRVNGGIHSKSSPHMNRCQDIREAFDDTEWLVAGLGTRTFGDLNSAVAMAAVEFLAKLLTSLPPATPGSLRLAGIISDPILNLFGLCIVSRNSILQMHFLDTLDALLGLEAAGFINSSNTTDSIPVTYADGKISSLNNLGVTCGGKSSTEGGCIESHPMFVPWILAGFSQACKATADGRDAGSEDVRGLRGRWIRFVGTVVKSLRSTFPAIVEGTILTLVRHLEARHSELDATDSSDSTWYAESEFSRIDERISLLKCLASISLAVIDAFEIGVRFANMNDDNLQAGSLSREIGLEPGRNVKGTGSALAGPPPWEPSGEARSSDATSIARANRYQGSSVDPSSTGMPLQHVVPKSLGPPSNAAHALPSSTPMTGATGSGIMMASMNPLRMLNDFVKDVFMGPSFEVSTRLLDPRREAARCLFLHLPAILSAAVYTWGHSDLSNVFKVDAGRYPRAQTVNHRMPLSPRLSRELPRERRQAQRAAVLAVVEPIFSDRPTDVIASIVSLFCLQSEIASSMDTLDLSAIEARRAMAVDMLHAIDKATPEVVVSCCHVLLDIAMKWDPLSPIAEDGKLQKNRKQAAEGAVMELFQGGVETGMRHLGNVSGGGPQKIASPILPGAAFETDVNGHMNAGTNSTRSIPNTRRLFHAGDFFSSCASSAVEVGVLSFLEAFLKTCKDGDDVLGAWPSMHAIAKDVLASSTRKASIPALVKALGASTGRPYGLQLEKRQKKELMLVSASAATRCSAIALGSVDISSEVQSSSAEGIRATLIARALNALATSIPVLVDAAFIDEGAQLSTTVGAVLGAAVSNLKRTAANASSIRSASRDTKLLSNGSSLSSRYSVSEEWDDIAALASADVMLEIAKREWGGKFVRKELVGLLDDPNFFFGKRGDVLSRMASVVSESFAAGGAAVLLSAIGSTTQLTSTGIPGLFTGRDSESVVRARAVRRVAFCVFVSEPDHYLAHLPTVLERLRDSLRLADPVLVVECFLCLRVLLLRTGPGSIGAFRASALSEMLRIISSPLQNLQATLSALQFLDLVTLLSPPDFGYERCFFFTSHPTTPPAERQNTSSAQDLYKPLIPELVTSLCDGLEIASCDDDSAQGLRLEAGQTVFSGVLKTPTTPMFIALYAKALTSRNHNPGMANVRPDIEVISRELEKEFVQ